jgi:hypothetical protein
MEFTQQALERISTEEMADIAGLLERKSAAFRELLAPERLPKLAEAEARALLRSVFVSRRRHQVILESLTLDGLRGLIHDLLWADDQPSSRLAAFHAAADGSDGAVEGRGVDTTIGFDLGSELLHFTDPERHWLWTRWMWNPESETGALPLVVTEEVDLAGEDVAGTYERIGVTYAFINDVGEAAGFRQRGHGVFDTDVFLACVYAVYLYTTLRMRMTQEFNQVVPDLGELLRRLLGVHRSPLLEKVGT